MDRAPARAPGGDREHEPDEVRPTQAAHYPAARTRAFISSMSVLGDDSVVFDWLPDAPIPAGLHVIVSLGFSQWSSAASEARTVFLRFDDDVPASLTFFATPFEVTPLGVTVTAPSIPGPRTLVAEVVDDATGRRVCANRLTVAVQ